MKKKIIGSIICMLLIIATVLPVAGTGEGDERENNGNSVGMQLNAWWSYHPVVNGCLIIWATENNKRICPWLFAGCVTGCTSYSGYIPDKIKGYTVTDWRYEFVWDASCHNYNADTVAVPTWVVDHWELEPIVSWIHENNASLMMPSIGDPTGINPHVYVMADLNVILEDPPIIQDEYFIEDGYCEDLPGYLIGTTPITFNPYVGPDDYPFETTPLTGELHLTSEVTVAPEPPPCCFETEIQRGFRIGVTAIIRNICDEEQTDVEWSMVINGTVFYPPGGEITGVIDSLPPGEEVTIKSGLVLGFGPAVITVTVDDCDPVSADATILGFLVRVRG